MAPGCPGCSWLGIVWVRVTWRGISGVRDSRRICGTAERRVRQPRREPWNPRPGLQRNQQWIAGDNWIGQSVARTGNAGRAERHGDWLDEPLARHDGPEDGTFGRKLDGKLLDGNLVDGNPLDWNVLGRTLLNGKLRDRKLEVTPRLVDTGETVWRHAGNRTIANRRTARQRGGSRELRGWSGVPAF